MDETTSDKDLKDLAHSYLKDLTIPANVLSKIVELFVHVKSIQSQLSSDEWGHVPNFRSERLCIIFMLEKFCFLMTF